MISHTMRAMTFVRSLFVVVAGIAVACIDSGKPYPKTEEPPSAAGGNAGSTSTAGADAGGAGSESSAGGMGGAPTMGGQSGCSSAIELPPVATVHEELDSPFVGQRVQASSRRPEVVDVVRLEDGAAYFRQFDGTWSTEISLGKPRVDGKLVDLVSLATTDVGSSTWIIAVGKNSHIYFRSAGDENNVFSVGPYGGWGSVADKTPLMPSVAASSSITATSWGWLRLDIFWWTADLELAHAWWDGAVSGDWSNVSFLVETSAKVSELRTATEARGGQLASAVTRGGDMHVFAAASSRISHHHYFNYGEWTHRVLHVVDDDCRPVAVQHLDAASRTALNIELFVSNADGIWHSWMREDAWRFAQQAPHQLRFGFVSDAAGRVSAGRMISPEFSLFIVGTEPDDVRHQILRGL